MAEFLMDSITGKTNFTVSKTVKEASNLLPSSMAVSPGPADKLSGTGGALNASSLFPLIGTSIDAVIPSDGLYQLMFTAWGPTDYGQPKPIQMRINATAMKNVGHAYYNGSSSHSWFVELKAGDKVNFGTPRVFYNYTMYPSYIQLNRWLIRKIAPIGGR